MNSVMALDSKALWVFTLAEELHDSDGLPWRTAKPYYYGTWGVKRFTLTNFGTFRYYTN